MQHRGRANPYVYSNSPDQLASDLANREDQEHGATRKAGPKTNVFGSAWLSLLDLVNSSQISWGRIVDLVPLMNAYRIQAENGQIYICTLGSLTGHQPHGARQTNMLPIGCGVVFRLPSQSHHGLIICVDPDYQTDPRNHRMDCIVQGSNVGLYADAAHDALLSLLADRGNIPCFNAGRPSDSTGIGEWGAITETGLAIHLDPFLGFFRVDEETGLYLFYQDQLARLAGHNLQIRSSVSESELLDDQQEAFIVQGQTPYPWEATGVYNWGDTGHRFVDNEDIQKTLQYYAAIEPSVDDQQPIHRLLKFGGYLGQIEKEMVVLPPTSAVGVNRYSALTKFNGVLNIQKFLDGTYAVESAKRIYLSKRICIPVPKCIARPEEPLGDRETTYKAAGLFGPDNGEEHKVTDHFGVGASAGPLELVRAAAILDLGAFVFNWQPGFHYHRLDWYLPQECEMALEQNQLPPSFCSLQSNQYLTAPLPYTLKVDHRNTSAKYYPNESYIVMLEDGGIAIGDGFGSEMRMTGGSITWSCPGDFNIMPGKNTNIWSGWDAVVKANNSVDISANNKDVRIKAQHDVQVLAGNDNWGGILLESRAQCPSYDFSQTGEQVQHSGILLLSRAAPVIALSSDFTITTSSDPVNEYRGHIRLVAGDGTDKDIKLYSRNQESFLANGRFDLFQDNANEFWHNATVIGNSTSVLGTLLASNGIKSKGWINVVSGHISTELADQFCNTIPKLPNGQVTLINTEITNIETQLATIIAETNDLADSPFDTELAASITNAQFSYRNIGNYKTTSGFVLFESRWQQIARLGSGIPATWTENAVSTVHGATYPHPGKENWADTPNYYKQELKLYDASLGLSVDRNLNQAEYETPAFGASTSVVYNGNYPIIRLC